MFLPKCAKQVHFFDQSYRLPTIPNVHMCACLCNDFEVVILFLRIPERMPSNHRNSNVKKFFPLSQHVISSGNTVDLHVIGSYPLRISTRADDSCQILQTNYGTVPLNRKNNLIGHTGC